MSKQAEGYIRVQVHAFPHSLYTHIQYNCPIICRVCVWTKLHQRVQTYDPLSQCKGHSDVPAMSCLAVRYPFGQIHIL
jgi:hypothetical protein